MNKCPKYETNEGYMYNITVIVLLNFYLRRTSELLVLHPNFSPGTQWEEALSFSELKGHVIVW